MAIPVPSVADLASFSGRSLSSYPSPYSDQALVQSVVFFSVMTELTDMPTDPTEAQLATFGILAYADALVLEQPYQSVTHNPFQSETVGSTSYSKPVMYLRGNLSTYALKGEQTGITWFDLAVAQLAKRTQRGGVFGGYEAIDFAPELKVCWDDNLGTWKVLGPNEQDDLQQVWFDWNTENWPAQEGNGTGSGGFFG